MSTYRSEFLGSTSSYNKDYVLGPEYFGTTIDIYVENLVGGVTYGVFALGAANQGGTMLDPAVVIFDTAWNILTVKTDGPPNNPEPNDPFWIWRGTTGPGKDPMFYFMSQLTPPQVGTYYIGVFDQTGAIGRSYTLSIEGAGQPIFFGGVAGVAGGPPDTTSDGTGTPDSGNTSPLPVVASGSNILPGVDSSNTTNDLIIGTASSEKLVGKNTNDQLVGGAGNDTLIGGRGDDTLFGGSGDNVLVGGKGRDIFALERGTGKSISKDFKKGQDKLGLTLGLGFSDLKFEQRNNGTLISAGKDQLMLLTGVQRNQIKAADFIQT